MKLQFSKSAVKFLKKLDTKNVDRIREKLASLLHFIEEQGVIPFTELARLARCCKIVQRLLQEYAVIGVLMKKLSQIVYTRRSVARCCGRQFRYEMTLCAA
jgi:mRNA-degrading endonuclease RelE of RelBE toxin-antitoxin system